MAKEKNRFNFFYAIILATQLGFLIAIPLVVILFISAFLDKKLKTFPLFIIVGTLLSLIVTFLETRYYFLPFLEKKNRKN